MVKISFLALTGYTGPTDLKLNRVQIKIGIWTPGSPPISGSRFNINIPTSTTIFHRQRRDGELTPVLISNILDKVNARMNATAFQCTLVGFSTSSKNPGQEICSTYCKCEVPFLRTLTRSGVYQRNRIVLKDYTHDRLRTSQ